MPPSKKPQNEKPQYQPVTTDPRFSHLHNDPRFIRPKKKDSKVTIDKRFAHMLSNKEFSAAPKVDKYGRKISSKKGAEDLKRFYQLEEEDKEENGESKKEILAKDKAVSNTKNEEVEEETDDESVSVAASSDEDEEEDEEESDDEDEDVVEEQPEYDASRGEGPMSSSDSDSDSDAESDVEGQEMGEDEEEEGDDAVPLGEETCRFAVMNMDWDKVKSIDLYTVFNGFKPTNGVIKSVKVYPSEFGKERIEKEEREGPPKDIFKDGGDESDDEEIYEDEGDDDEQLIKEDTGEEFDMVKLRKYQLERLRYYYAVVECDSIETASAIYRACDGAEYESSANFFDLRFVPDDMTFDDPPRDVATDVPEHYRPRDFSTDVLQHSKVKLTWDDDDVDRVAVTRRPLSKEEIKSMDFSAYLADSSDEGDGDSDDDIAATRKKYRSLLAEIHGDEEDEDDEKAEGEMEITFAPGLSEAASALLKKKKEEESLETETTLQTYVRKQKEKRQRKKTDKSKSANEEGEGEALFSDDDVAVDMNDPYFAEEMGTTANEPSKKSKKSNKKDRKPTLEERAESDRQRRELELLVLGDDEGARDHFNLKDVVKSEKLTNRKKSRLEKKKKMKGDDDEEVQKEFRIDTKDSRFAALHDSHHFAIDPTNPAFKKTAAMKELMTERQKAQRRKTDREEGNVPSSSSKEKKGKDSGEKDTGANGSLAKLVESVKRKSAHFATQKGDGKRSKLK